MLLLLIMSVLLNIYLLEYTIKGKTLKSVISVYKVIKDYLKSKLSKKEE